jgi:succinate-acetate transporter protein
MATLDFIAYGWLWLRLVCILVAVVLDFVVFLQVLPTFQGIILTTWTTFFV